MKVIILGAGQVGTSVANALVSEANDITVVDQDPALLRKLQDRLDLQTVLGHGAHPQVLRRAGAAQADMILAVTNSDETNMVACQVAYTLFKIPTKVARVRAQDFTRFPELFSDEAMPIDVLISPEQLVTDYITRVIEHPGALQVLDFTEGRVRLVAVRAYYGGPLVGKELRTLYDRIPDVEARVAAIYRKGKAIRPRGDTIIEADDEVFFLATKKNIRAVMSELRKLEKPFKRLIFAGGGNIGFRLARTMEKRYQIKVIEKDRERAKYISEELKKSIVLHGNAADSELLLEENIEKVDVFCAITDDDEANILSAMLAKQLGARKVMALINRAVYVDLIESGSIDVAISPQQVMIGSLLTYVRRGDVANVHSLRRGAAEAIEAVAHGDRNSSQVVGRAIEEINLPTGATIGAIVRGDEVLMARHDAVVESGDHVILFLIDKSRIAEVEQLFEIAPASP